MKEIKKARETPAKQSEIASDDQIEGFVDNYPIDPEEDAHRIQLGSYISTSQKSGALNSGREAYNSGLEAVGG